MKLQEWNSRVKARFRGFRLSSTAGQNAKNEATKIPLEDIPGCSSMCTAHAACVVYARVAQEDAGVAVMVLAWRLLPSIKRPRVARIYRISGFAYPQQVTPRKALHISVSLPGVQTFTGNYPTAARTYTQPPFSQPLPHSPSCGPTDSLYYYQSTTSSCSNSSGSRKQNYSQFPTPPQHRRNLRQFVTLAPPYSYFSYRRPQNPYSSTS
ncbi:hypothetical protein EJ06DRAFT_519980 [Trichodelitschia bisporula]|uniref:Uncharacterized protein n=1 Tax=Trichodelitschia bisporula TaxID=703511 RepID=A0A6G1I4M8_9PEZI|nr:hypothetical protein EJ06DRAFT_519980 [Trichodelitschia bisporula]